MHELSLATSVVDFLQRFSKEQGMNSIDAIFLEIGEMTHVDPSQLRYSLKMVSQGTVAEKSKVYIRRSGIVLRCRKCGKDSRLKMMDTITDYSLKCIGCGSMDVDIDKGRELVLRRIKGSK
ncbi:MAG: hydrogenase maturation nickel metallochaperone HypA [Candidatus Methanomethyliaceae archaeon]|nr:hydrogenase maturation nickel metallochaperone HypA [Candidatus Methanomethyliaceae archaeon]